MWIIPKTHPLYSAYAADMVVSKEDLSLPGLNIESSLMWRSKPSQLKTWCQRWKRVSWLPHLYSRILKPCQRKSFETELTSFWGATRVSLFRKPGNVPGSRTPDTSGLSSGITSEQLDLFDVSLKMSKDTSHSDSERSLEIWKNSVTKVRGAYLARKRSMHLTKENGFLSWPTPRVVDTEGGTAKNVELKDGSFSRVNADGVRFGVKLKDAVDQQMKYPTPNVSDSKGANMVPESDGVPHDIKKRYLRGMVFDNKKQWPTVRVSSANGSSEKEIAEGNPKYRLETTVDIIERENWATPNTMDHLPPRSAEAMAKHLNHPKRKGQKRPENLREQVSIERESWATPNTMDHLPQRSEEALIKQATTSRKGRKRPANLREQVDPEAVEIYEKQNLYPTPTTDSATNRKDKYKQGGTSLSTAVNLKTPTASDYKNMDTANQVMLYSQVKDKKGYALSPDWVEKMMGVPPGWTALDGTSNEWDGIESWADGSWDSGPRVVQHCEDRIDRIRLLGNGVVPATAAKAWIILEQQLDEDSN